MSMALDAGSVGDRAEDPDVLGTFSSCVTDHSNEHNPSAGRLAAKKDAQASVRGFSHRREECGGK